MIHKPERLAYILGISEKQVEFLIQNIDHFYYEDNKPKLSEDGTPKLRNGEIQYRILYPSTGFLKEVQSSIKLKIFSKIKLPPHIKSAKKSDNIKTINETSLEEWK